MSDSDNAAGGQRGRGFTLLMLAALCVLVALIYHKLATPDNPSAPAFASAAPGVSASAGAAVAALSGDAFRQRIGSGVHVVDFWATWCGPCRTQAPIMERLAQRYAGKATVGKVDVDAEGDLASQYNIRSIPTIIVFKDGREAARFVGVTEEAQLASAVNGML